MYKIVRWNIMTHIDGKNNEFIRYFSVLKMINTKLTQE